MWRVYVAAPPQTKRLSRLSWLSGIDALTPLGLDVVFSCWRANVLAQDVVWSGRCGRFHRCDIAKR